MSTVHEDGANGKQHYDIPGEENHTNDVPPCESETRNGKTGERRRKDERQQRKIVATYNYTDEAGKLLFQSVRYEPKDFHQRRPDGKGGWLWNLKDTRLVLYRLPEILQAETVFIGEGEKDVERLRSLGLTATTNAGGAEKWREEYNQYLAKKHVVILPDNDAAGEKHTLQVARSLPSVATTFKIVRLAGLPPKGDVSDWLDAGHTKEELLALVAATPSEGFSGSSTQENEENTPCLLHAQRNGDGSHKHTHVDLSEAERRDILAELKEALPFIPAVEHDIWLQVGMGLHFVDSSESGFAVWVAWSQTCPEKFDLADCHKRWRSFHDDGGITHKSIFALAIEHGWRNAGTGTPQLIDLFAGEQEPDEQEPDEPSQSEDTAETVSPTEKPRFFNLTDLGNGERLIARYGENLRYCNPWKKWLCWNGQQWKIDDEQVVKRHARRVIRSLYGDAAKLMKGLKDIANKKTKKKIVKQHDNLVKHAINSENGTRVTEMVRLAQMDVPIMPARLDTNRWLLNVANGTLDLKTGVLHPHRREDLLTKCIPLPYDPDATCPGWEQFLDDIMAGKTEMLDFLWKAIGYSLSGDVREDCLFLLYGTGANGKSTLLSILRTLLADYGKQAAFSTFLHQERDNVRNDLADLQGARFVTASETDEGKRLSMSVVKALTGQDTIKARFLFAEFFEFAPQMKIWLAANHKPIIRGTDHAIWRRIRLIPFTQKFEGASKDDNMRDKLLAELPGILAWAVRGCLAWQTDGLPMPETVQKATEEYKTESDVIGGFLNECCRLQKDLQTSASNLLEAFKSYSGDKNFTHMKMKAALEEKGFMRERSSVTGLMMWQGIGILLAGDNDDS